MSTEPGHPADTASDAPAKGPTMAAGINQPAWYMQVHINRRPLNECLLVSPFHPEALAEAEAAGDVDPVCLLKGRPFVWLRDNTIVTAKYNPFNFLPKFLFEQFQRVANFYFLCISAIQMSSTRLAPTGRFYTFVPLVIILILTGIKELIFDIRRRRQDILTNRQKTQVLRPYVARVKARNWFTSIFSLGTGTDFMSDYYHLEHVEEELREIRWSELRSGDIVMLRDGDPAPADLFLISSTADDGLCHIETSQLDGETNLKTRQALPVTNAFQTVEQVRTMAAAIEYEAPNRSLYSFEGTLQLADGRSFPVGPNQMILRGTRLRNTTAIFGVVLYTGHQTKLMLNAEALPPKKSLLEKTVNRQIAFIFGLLILMSIICLICYINWNRKHLRPDPVTGAFAWYLGVTKRGTAKDLVAQFVSFIILYNTIIPISLYITIEIVKIYQAFFVSRDLKLFHEATGTPTVARTPNIGEALGQVDFVFADKTGTLTRNHMLFRKCSILGRSYGLGFTESYRAMERARGCLLPADPAEMADLHADWRFYDPQLLQDVYASAAGMKLGPLVCPGSPMPEPGTKLPITPATFILAMALCHTTLPSHRRSAGDDQTSGASTPGIISAGCGLEHVQYQGASPDEVALVQAANLLGVRFTRRTPEHVGIRVPRALVDGRSTDIGPLPSPEDPGTDEDTWVTLDFALLHVLEFDADRKRMSIIVRDAAGRVLIFCKGADNTMLARLSEESRQSSLTAATAGHLEDFSREGLRTLCYAVGEIDPETYDDWRRRYHLACTTLDRRYEEMELCHEEVERNLTLLGATAIEDQLQEGVPETIQTLLQCGIRVWMLTGDKRETAINIGMCSQLVPNRGRILTTDADTLEDVTAWLRATLSELGMDPDKPPRLRDPLWRQVLLMARPRAETVIEDLTLVLEGSALALALADPTARGLLVRLALVCKSCVFCRASPLQKAEVVSLVRASTPIQCTTLAIGDGANDITMIQTACVGIGISGAEGMAAARSADYSTAQFRFLAPLLMVHGHRTYRRLSKVILYSLYKTMTLYMVSFFFTFDNGFSGQLAWDPLSNALWNVIYTFLPIIFVGVLDQDLPDAWLARDPELYRTGPRNDFFNLWSFLKSIAGAITNALIIYQILQQFVFGMNIPGAEGGAIQRDGRTFDLISRGTQLYMTVIVTIFVKIFFVNSFWTKRVAAGTFIPLAVYFLIIAFLGRRLIESNPDSMIMYGVMSRLGKAGGIWLPLVLALVVMACHLVQLVVRSSQVMFRPSYYDQTIRAYHQARREEARSKGPGCCGMRRGRRGTGGSRSATGDGDHTAGGEDIEMHGGVAPLPRSGPGRGDGPGDSLVSGSESGSFGRSTTGQSASDVSLGVSAGGVTPPSGSLPHFPEEVSKGGGGGGGGGGGKAEALGLAASSSGAGAGESTGGGSSAGSSDVSGPSSAGASASPGSDTEEDTV